MRGRLIASAAALATLVAALLCTPELRGSRATEHDDGEETPSAGEEAALDADLDAADFEAGDLDVGDRSSARTSPATWGRIVSADGGAPIAGARMRWWSDSKSDVVFSDSSGEVELPVGVLVCWSAADGFQNVVSIADTSSAVEIALPRGAGLELAFRSGEGPESGVEAEALLELGALDRELVAAQRHWLPRLRSKSFVSADELATFARCAGPVWVASDTWSTHSDERGIAAWSSLPPGRWRWRLRSRAALAIDPPYEREAIEFTAAGARVTDVPANTSGAFELAAGEVRRFECELSELCGLRGRVVFADGTPAADIRVLARRIETALDPLGVQPEIESARIAGEVRSASDGAFELLLLEPGRFELTAARADSQQHFDFATAQLSVGEGESRDAGVLALGGASLRGRVEFVDAATRAVLDPRLVAADPSKTVRVDLHWAAPRVQELLSIAVGEPFEIRGGLDEGRYFAAVEAEASLVGLADTFALSGELPSVVFDRPAFNGELAFEIPLARIVRVRLIAHLEAVADERWRVEGELIACRGGAREPFEQWLPANELDLALGATPGEHWIWARAIAGSRARVCAWQRVEIADAQRAIELEWRPAVDVEGVAVALEGGTPVSNAVFEASPVDAPPQTWLLRTRTDEFGHWKLRCAPAETRLRFRASPDQLDTTASGASGVTVRIDTASR